jgi:acetate kinase
MATPVLAINAGSSSIKFALFDHALKALVRGCISGIGKAARFTARDADETLLCDENWPGQVHEEFLEPLLSWLEAHGSGNPSAVGHRIVHGGANFTGPQRLDAVVLGALEQLVPLAPLHQPHNLSPVRALAALKPDLPQFGCFDTGFHATIGPTARRFGLPRPMEAAGLRRYGFHGLSYEFVSRRLGEIAPGHAGKRIIVAHLGNGASLCALKGGRSVDTTMGMTALDGLVMGTRCGALDPGAMLQLMKQGRTAAELEDLLYLRSGLLGVSGISADMRDLLESGRTEAAQAVDLFVFRAVREIGALAASLGGLDGLVFTAGIGENSAVIRRRICEGSAWLGVFLDESANRAHALSIMAASSRIPVWVIPTDEESAIARQVHNALASGGA